MSSDSVPLHYEHNNDLTSTSYISYNGATLGLLKVPNSDDERIHENNRFRNGIGLQVVSNLNSSKGAAIEESPGTTFGNQIFSKLIVIKQLSANDDTRNETENYHHSGSEKFKIWWRNRCWIKNSVTIIILILVIALIATITARLILLKQLKGEEVHHEIVVRSTWGALQPREYTDLQLPVKRVIISHTVRPQCMNFDECYKEIRAMQLYEMASDPDPDADIAVNFLVGGDGSAFEGRGYRVGAHTRPYGANRNSICIAFMGNFNAAVPTTAQLEAAKRIIEEGIKQKKIHPEYKLYGHRQFYPTDSPGHLLYGIIKSWPHYSPVLVDISGIPISIPTPKGHFAKDEVTRGAIANDEITRGATAKDEIVSGEIARNKIAKDENVNDEIANDEIVNDEIVNDEIARGQITTGPMVKGRIPKGRTLKGRIKNKGDCTKGRMVRKEWDNFLLLTTEI